MRPTLFHESLRAGNSLSPAAIAAHLRRAGVRYVTHVSHRPNVAADRAGIDYVAHRAGGRRPLLIDLKELSHVPTDPTNPNVLLETTAGSNAGWATDEAKRTDLFLLVYGDGNSLVLSARQVRAALQEHGAHWETRYRTGRNMTRGFFEDFSSTYLIVPASELISACREVTDRWASERAAPPARARILAPPPPSPPRQAKAQPKPANFSRRSAPFVSRGAAQARLLEQLAVECPALVLLANQQSGRASLSAGSESSIGAMLARLRLVPRRETFRLLRKLRSPHCTAQTANDLAKWLREPPTYWHHVLRHVTQITSDVLALLLQPPSLITPRLLLEAAKSPPGSKPVTDAAQRVFALHREWRPGAPWPYKDLDFLDLLHVEEKLVDQVIRGESQRFPRPPLPGIEGWIEPLTDLASLKSESEWMNHCITPFFREIADGSSYIYAVLRPERATLVIQRKNRRWGALELCVTDGRRPKPATEALIQGWLGAQSDPAETQ